MSNSLPVEGDLVLLFTALQTACDAAVVRMLADEGFGDLRRSHGYVFQHLVPGPARVTDLAEKLGMTPQGASKAVIELETLGYVERTLDQRDRRNHRVVLTARGWAAIEAARRARATLTARLTSILGEDDAEVTIRSLHRLAEETGGLQALLSRRLRPTD